MASRRQIEDALARAEANAPFLRQLIARERDLAAGFAAGDFPEQHWEADDGMPVMARLRRARRRTALAVAIGDLSGVFDLTEVTRRLTAFADAVLDAAIHAAIAERTPGAVPAGFVAIALGKQGSGELNYSSDIDPIFLFDPATLPTRSREEPQEAAVRIAKRVIDILQTRDGDGYVLRVDLRLRPSPEATPPALSIDAATGYYESQALPWERAAYIRARACAGDVALGRRFLEAIRPFVWRRALDFGAIGEIRDISRRIRGHHQGQAFGPGFDLKRGRGGIREIEFFTQIHQLIHGGRDPGLREPATRDALSALAAAGRLDPDEAAELGRTYTLLRTIEHRLQMVDDRQTHELPRGAALDGVGRLHGLTDGAALLDLLRAPVAHAGRSYDAIEPNATEHLALAAEPLAAQFAAAGFGDPDAAVRRIAEWRGGAYPAVRSAAAQAALEAVLPGLTAALGAAADPDTALLRFDRMLSKVPHAINLFRLLHARPGLAQLLATVLSHAPTLADALGRRAELLDGLIDASALDPVGSVAELADAMRSGHAAYEAGLDHVRRIVREARFALGVQIVAGVGDPLEATAGYARVAEAAIVVLTDAAVARFESAHGRVPNSELVILAFGRLGGQALTHASDLDLIYLFTGDFATESDGDKPLGATLYYNRLAQRVTAALSVPTAAGPLYDVDTRLRPSGEQGPLAVSLDSFARYQREDAWTWEHMALTRARPVYGSPAARALVARTVARVLGGERRTRDVVADAAAMRTEMTAHKPPAGPLDAKLLSGGLVDLEFAVHVAQLTTGTGLHPDLRDALPELVAVGAVPDLMPPLEFLTRLLVAVRLMAPDDAEPDPATQAVIARAVGVEDWSALLARLASARQDVAAAWAMVAAGG